MTAESSHLTGSPNGDAECVQRVVDGGYCIGCGVCAVLQPGLFRMSLNEYGEYQADQRATGARRNDVSVEIACPFSGRGKNEDAIGQGLYGSFATYDPRIGYHLAAFAGFVREGGYRADGSSGGLLTWVLVELLERQLVDAVIHVRPRIGVDGRHPLFSYTISRTADEVCLGAKSRYYPVEISRVVEEVRALPGRYVFVGIPCFVKAVRSLAEQDSILSERIRYCVALICGHLKSAAFTDAIAWESGVHPEQLVGIDFRHKLAGRRAIDYGVKIDLREGGHVVRPMEGLATQDWGAGLFKYRACDYCDDVVGETADISVGDAWLPQYVHDSRGTNVAIVRHADLLAIIRAAIPSRLDMVPISSDEVADSQRGGFRHRREGLRYRLWRKARHKEWFPEKRVTPSREGISRRYQRIYALRETLAHEGRQAFLSARCANDYTVFLRKMKRPLGRYAALYKGPLWRRLLGRIKRYLRRIADTGCGPRVR